MKVLNVNHLLDPVTGGGTAERTFQLSRFLSRAGVRTTVATLDIGITQARRDALSGVNVVALPCMNRRYFLPRTSAGTIHKLVADADLVHLSGHWTVLNALMYKSCLKQGKPFLFCPAGALTPFGRSTMLKRVYDALVGRAIARSAAACVAITEHERPDFTAYGVAPERVTVIPNGIDPEEYNYPAAQETERQFREHFALGTAPYLLFLGRLNKIKGPDLLLEAFYKVAYQFPELHLVFAGPDGGMQSSLMAKAGQHPLARNIHFTGHLAGEEKAAALRAARLLVIPSRREAMSMVVLEAGICGTAVLFTNACGLEEMARVGAGTMVDVTVEGLAVGLAGLLANESLISDMASRLEALVRENYLWKTQAERYLRLYERTLGGERR